MKLNQWIDKGEKIPLKFWLIFALLCRIILAFTYHSYNHADEWYQTVEQGYLLWGKKATYSPEIYWHLRNLTWPGILSLVERVTYFLFPESFWMQISFVQLFCVLFDFLGLIFILKLIEKWNIEHKKLWSVFFLTAHFLLRDSTRPSQEHISTFFFIASLYCGAYFHFFWAGICASLIGACKYSTGILSAGLYFAFLVLWIKKSISLKQFLRFNAGVILGILLCGIPDYYVYGTFYKSMWGYFYYVLYSGISDRVFGIQGPVVYIKYLFSQWKILHFGLFLFLLSASSKRLWKVIKENLTLLVPTIMYILFMVLVLKHKEGRFITQVEVSLWLILSLTLSAISWAPKWLPRILSVLILFNLIFSLIQLPGDLSKPSFAYFHLPKLAKSETNLCAAIVLKRPLGAFFLKETINQAFWPLGKKNDVKEAMERLPLYWYNNNTCTEKDFVLVQTYKQSLDCTKLDTFGSHWYKCPSSILAQFKKQVVKNFLVDHFYPFEVPDTKTPGTLMEARQSEFEKSHNLSIGSFPDW